MENNNILNLLIEIKDALDKFDSIDTVSGGELQDTLDSIMNAILSVGLLITQPKDPHKALFDAYEQVRIFRREQNKREQQIYDDYLNKHPEMQKMISYPKNNSLIQQLVALDKE